MIQQITRAGVLVALALFAPAAGAGAETPGLPEGLPVAVKVGKGTPVRAGTELHGVVTQSTAEALVFRTARGERYRFKWNHVKVTAELAKGDLVALTAGSGTSLKTGSKVAGIVRRLDAQGVALEVAGAGRYYVKWSHIRRVEKLETAVAAKPAGGAASRARRVPERAESRSSDFNEDDYDANEN